MVREDGPEARPRLDAGIPFLGRLMLFPGHIAEIVERGEMRRRGNVREREMIAPKPATALDEVADIVEMVAEIGLAGADHRRVGLPESQKALHHLLADE